jgi:hypothetical protein
MKKKKAESGVSELIGAILLVSLVVMLMMVVTTVLISQPRPEKIPELSLSISLIGSDGHYSVKVTHMGGDDLGEGEYFVIINGKPALLNGPTLSVINPVITVSSDESKPLSVEMYYKGASNQVLLAKTNFQ